MYVSMMQPMALVSQSLLTASTERPIPGYAITDQSSQPKPNRKPVKRPATLVAWLSNESRRQTDWQTDGPRNKFVDSSIWTNKVARKKSDKYSTSRPVYHALSVHLSQATSITRFDDRYTEAKFSKTGVWDSSRVLVPLFL